MIKTGGNAYFATFTYGDIEAVATSPTEFTPKAFSYSNVCRTDNGGTALNEGCWDYKLYYKKVDKGSGQYELTITIKKKDGTGTKYLFKNYDVNDDKELLIEDEGLEVYLRNPAG